MLVLAIINAVGLSCGFFINPTAAYVIFGIAFVAFFNTYAKGLWKLVYEPFLGGEAESALVDPRLMNIVSIIIFMAGVYFMVCFKAGGWCMAVSAAQTLIFQCVKLKKEFSEKQLTLLIVFILELVIAVSFVLFS